MLKSFKGGGGEGEALIGRFVIIEKLEKLRPVSSLAEPLMRPGFTDALYTAENGL